MKQIAQNYKSGDLRVVEVPPPACLPGGVLVRTQYSLISTGTEVMKVTEANLSLVGKARARPEQVRKLADGIAQQGVRATYAKAMQRLDSLTPLGYSACGVVVEVGQGAEEFKIGQVIACAGNEFALHAEVNWVPRNLCVPVPEGVDPRLAAFATVGAIAMHGVRRGEVSLGDTACVVGLGLVGQLTVQLLVASGVQVVGLDIVPDRCRMAEEAGAVACDAPDADGLARLERVLADVSGGIGADHVFLVAGGSSNQPVTAAARLARDRAHVVDIGKLSLDLPWNAYYEKELDVRFSRSYGPGRYDSVYEVEGVDYPVGYVRWTERRNIQCFLDLVARGALPIERLISGTFALDDAADVYRRLSAGELAGVGFLFRYADPGSDLGVAAGAMSWSASDAPLRRRPATHLRSRDLAKLRLGFIGAGNYASSMLLPHLAGRDDVELAHVVTNTSLSAANAQRRFAFSEASTDAERVLADGSIDAIFVVTRHHDHAELAARSLASGKATFVEKPLALDAEQLDQVVEATRSSGNDRLMVGFNRRFAPLLTGLRDRFGPLDGPAMVRYEVNAGPLSADSWYLDAAREGSRFSGEGGHFLDTVAWWLDATPVEVYSASTGRAADIHVTVRYDDGSVAIVDYLTSGNPRYPKETLEVAAGGRTARLDNFRRATLWKGRRPRVRRARGAVDKGQRHELDAFLHAVRTGNPMPIALEALVATTAATLAVERSLANGQPVRL